MKKLSLLLLLNIIIYPLCYGVNLFDDRVYRPMIADRKAFLPGDVLTVIVLETSNAQTGADLSSGKEIQTALQASYNRHKYEVGVGLKGNGKTQAKTGRNGKIKASLTVQIKDVLPNGTYHIEGRQLIRINGELQTIILGGIVRQEDISAQNTVLSTRLADAQITYSGEGSVSNSQRYNYMYKMLSIMGLV